LLRDALIAHNRRPFLDPAIAEARRVPLNGRAALGRAWERLGP
jgi:hypothetical protein